MTLFQIGISWLGGIGLGAKIELETWQWAVLAFTALLSLIGFRGQARFRSLFLSTLFICLGAGRFQLSQRELPRNHIARYNDIPAQVAITGTVIDYPERRDAYIGLVVEVESLQIEGMDNPSLVQGRVRVQVPRFRDWSYGDHLRATGKLTTPPEFETFSYRDYLARKGIHSLMRYSQATRTGTGGGTLLFRWIYALRRRALKTIYALFPDPEASLLAGILVGVERGIPAEIREAFNATGTTHIIAISGFNLTIIASLFINLFGRLFGTRRGIFIAGLGIAGYTLLVGADAAVVRAAIMGSLTLLARLLGRQTHGLASLSAAAMGMTALHPSVLWDISFQLSFAATLGLMLYAKPLEMRFVRLITKWKGLELAERLAKPVNEFFLFTFAAQITTLPLTAFYFQRLPLISFLANPVILPAQPALMISAGFATLIGMVSRPLGQPLAWMAWVFPSFTIRAVSLFAKGSLRSFLAGPIPVYSIVAYYLILFSITAFFLIPAEQRPKIHLTHGKKASGLAILAILTLLIWRMHADRADGKLHLHVLDVGQGDALLIQTPEGRSLLINGGPSSIALSDALGPRLPLLNRRLDWLVLTGSKEDQLGGLANTLPRFPPTRTLLATQKGGSAYRYLLEQLTEQGIPLRKAEVGQVLSLGEGASLEVFALNEQGAILLLTFDRFQALLASGANPENIATIKHEAIPGRTTVMLLADGGFLAANPPQWLEKIRPSVAIISVDAANSRGLPSDEVMQALSESTILRTDRHGWIELATDGIRLWVEVERNLDGFER